MTRIKHGLAERALLRGRAAELRLRPVEGAKMRSVNPNGDFRQE